VPKSVLSRGRKFVARLTALAMVASIMVIGAAPASAAIDTSASCPSTTASAGFTDIGGFDATTQNAINCLVAYEISQGTSATTFSPAGEVSRWQMALFLTRQAEVHGLTLPSGAAQGFSDIGAFDASTQTAINQLAQLDITQGTSATTFSPNDIVTRWQMALFLTRLAEAAGLTLPSGADQGFTDITGLDAATQTAINQAKQLGIADGTSATTYNPMASTLRWQMALFLTRTLAAGGVTPVGVIGPNPTFTAAPELVSVEKGTSGIVRFNFDTAIPGQSLTAADFRLYTPDGSYEFADTLSISGQTVVARYSTAEVASAVRAGARTGAVETGTGIPSIAGGFALTASASQISPIDPNLVSVGNYRFSDEIDLGNQLVLVDFVFDDATNAVSGIVADIFTDGNIDAAFSLVGNNGQLFSALVLEEPITSYDTDADQTTVSVAFATDPTDVPQSQLRRGVFVDVLGVANATGTDITWAANFGSTNGNTVDPDLVSVTREGSTGVFQFEFDEAISTTPITAASFFLVDDSGDVHQGQTATRLADANADTARVQFAGGTFDPATDTAIHGYVLMNAVVATDSLDSDNAGQNHADSAPVTIPVIADPTPGKTAALDLVSAQRFQDTVTGRFSIQLTFDQAVTVLNIADLDVVLYDSAGVAFAVATGGAGITVSGSTATITSDNAGLTDDQIEATVTVAVQDNDVAELAPVATEGQVGATQLTQN
jgi:hypothetical protein